MPHAAAGRQIDGIEQSIFSLSATAPIPRPSSISFPSCRLGGPSMLFSRRVDSLPFWPFQFLIDPKLHKSRRELPHRLSAGQSHTMRRGSVTSFRGEYTSKPYWPTELAGNPRPAE